MRLAPTLAYPVSKPHNANGPADTQHPRGRPIRAYAPLPCRPYLALSACIRVATDSTSVTLSASTAGFSLAA